MSAPKDPPEKWLICECGAVREAPDHGDYEFLICGECARIGAWIEADDLDCDNDW